VLVQFNSFAILLGIGSLAVVAVYPFMKRITNWPQLVLGLAFSCGALMGWAAEFGDLARPAVLLYLGSIFWVIGYDTIYALQDIEDDALVGVKSSARALGRHARPGIALSYALALLLWGLAIHGVRREWFAPLGLAPMALHLAWQVAGLKPADGVDALRRFRSNRTAGLLMFLACLVVGTA
jgi:4-hydroxybenzoate polyprenyltransferase